MVLEATRYMSKVHHHVIGELSPREVCPVPGSLVISLSCEAVFYGLGKLA